MTTCEEWNRTDDAPQDAPCAATATERTPAGRNLCQTHADAFWKQRQQTERDYPDSPIAPAWYKGDDYIGESWNEPGYDY